MVSLDVSRLAALLAGAALCLGGCARPGAAPARAAAPWNTPGYSWPPRSDDVALEKGEHEPRAARLGKSGEPNEEEKGPLPAPVTPEPTRAARLESAACLAALSEHEIPHRVLEELPGVATPIEIEGPIGPVTYWVNGGGPLRMDCRLALALFRLSPELERHGVTRARFSGAYVYRTTRGGRLSHHAHGLALDVHEVLLDGRVFDVKRDFVRNAGCDGDVPRLNRLACDLRQSRLFEEFLTPDYDADHHDHIHLAVPRP